MLKKWSEFPLKWVAIAFLLLVPLLGIKFEQLREARERQANPAYYAHIDRFGSKGSGVSKSAISQYLAGQRIPSIPVLEKIAKFLNRDFQDLFKS